MSEAFATDVAADALSVLDEGVAIFCPKVGLIHSNAAWRAHQCDAALEVIAIGVPFSQVLTLNLQHGAVRHVSGNEEAWLSRCITAHENCSAHFELALDGDRVVEVRERRDRDGRCVQVTRDISALDATKNALEAVKLRFAAYADIAADWFFETNADLEFTFVSGRHQKLTGLAYDEVLGRTHWEVYPSLLDDAPEVLERHLQNLQDRHPYELTLTCTCGDGVTRIFKYIGQPRFESSGAFVGYRGIGRDITDDHHSSERIRFRATHDMLTGLLNRDEFERRLQENIETVKNSSAEHTLFFMDLDRFKAINDQCGHEAGDDVLRELSALFKGAVREVDTVARLGGDEFAVLLLSCPVDQGKKVAEKIRAAVEEFRYTRGDLVFSLGVSIGIAPINDRTTGLVDLLRSADSACFAAKRAGRNRVQVCTEGVNASGPGRGEMRWMERIGQALEQGRLRLACQTVQTLQERTHPAGLRFEVLLRIKGQRNEIILPAEFLPAAERYQLASRLDQWVIETTLSWLQKQGENLARIERCSINLASQTLREEGLIEFVADHIKRTGVPANKLCFEISENVTLSYPGDVMRSVLGFKGLGCRCALDNFGGSLGSFSQLKRLPLDEIKIDGAFIRRLGIDAVNGAVLKAIAEVAGIVGMNVTAKHVEDERVLGILRDCGVGYAQGHLFAHPIWLDELLTTAKVSDTVARIAV